MPSGSSSAGIDRPSAAFGSTSWTSPLSTIGSHLDCVGSTFIRSAYSTTLDIDSALHPNMLYTSLFELWMRRSA